MKKIILSLSVLMLFSYTQISAQQITLNKSNINEIIEQMTLEEKVHMCLGCGMGFGEDVPFPGTAGRTYAIPRLGIPSVYMADGPHGVRMSESRPFDSREYITTEFPTSTSVAASWNAPLAKEIGAAIGEQIRDYGLDIILAPGINLHRNALCGRNHEYYSEDPVLTGKISAAYVMGAQETGAGTCVKHFAVNNQETNRNANDSRLDQRTLREIYLKAFEIVVKDAQPWSIMTAYNKVNGLYTSENKELTEDILRNEWGFLGCVMSDWNAGQDAAASMAAGNDMMQPGQDRQYKAILEAVQNGTLDEAFVDRSVSRILQLVVKCMTFNGNNYSNEPDLKAHAALTRKAGAETLVLLKNEQALPISNTVKNIALHGTTSYDIVSGAMGFGGTGTGHYSVSLVEGLRNAGYTIDNSLIKRYRKHHAEEQKRIFPDGKPPFSLTPLERAAEISFTDEELAAEVKNNDIAIITLARVSGEAADRTEADFYLTDSEKVLIQSVSKAYHAAGKKVIVLLNVCGPIETASWRNSVDGLVCVWQPGEQVGNSIADVLSGKVSPSGKLPMTFALKYGDAPSDANFPSNYDAKGRGFSFGKKDDPEKKPERNIDYTDYEEGIYVGYRYFDTFNKNVAYPFGYGLSYTSFDYEVVNSNIQGETCEVKVKVKNTGKYAGKEAVQLYVKAPAGGLGKPSKELKAFAKTKQLQPGESEVLTLSWNVMDMASFNIKSSSWELAKGDYKWLVGASSTDIRCTIDQKVAKAQKVKANDVMKPQVTIKAHPMVASTK